MYALIGLLLLPFFGGVLALQNVKEVIWFPSDEYEDRLSSSLGTVDLTERPNYLGFEYGGSGRNSRSIPDHWIWNALRTEKRRNAEDEIVFPQEIPEAQSEPKLVSECEKWCPHTPEYNPVCGSNFVNYDNMGALKCSQFCGQDVRFVHYGLCGKGLSNVFRPSPRPPRRSRRHDVIYRN